MPITTILIHSILFFSTLFRSLVELDHEILLAVNGWHAQWADTLMWYISQSTTWLPLYAVLVGLIVWRFGIKPYRAYRREPHAQPPAQSYRFWLPVLMIFVAFAVAVGGADFIASGIIKHIVCRPRPTHNAHLANLLHIVHGYRGGMYGFVSSHAANTTACALLFSLLWRKKTATCLLLLWVALNCYSRMYLGVHYLSDIIGGLIVGAATAGVAYAILCCCLPRIGTAHHGYSEQADEKEDAGGGAHASHAEK